MSYVFGIIVILTILVVVICPRDKIPLALGVVAIGALCATTGQKVIRGGDEKMDKAREDFIKKSIFMINKITNNPPKTANIFIAIDSTNAKDSFVLSKDTLNKVILNSLVNIMSKGSKIGKIYVMDNTLDRARDVESNLRMLDEETVKKLPSDIEFIPVGFTQSTVMKVINSPTPLYGDVNLFMSFGFDLSKIELMSSKEEGEVEESEEIEQDETKKTDVKKNKALESFIMNAKKVSGFGEAQVKTVMNGIRLLKIIKKGMVANPERFKIIGINYVKNVGPREYFTSVEDIESKLSLATTAFRSLSGHASRAGITLDGAALISTINILVPGSELLLLPEEKKMIIDTIDSFIPVDEK
jgi:hypothetical protein